MQWDGSANAGFSPAGVKPWLPVANDYQTFNVAAEQQDPRSFLMLTRTLLAVRRSHSALTLGSYQSVTQESDTCFVYQRQYADQRCLVALNFSAQEQVVALPEQGQGRVLLSTHLLAEVEETCSRVLILNRGRVVAEGTVAEVARQAAAPRRATVRVAPEHVERALEKLWEAPGGERVAPVGGLVEPLECLLAVLPHPLARRITLPQVRLGKGIAQRIVDLDLCEA